MYIDSHDVRYYLFSCVWDFDDKNFEKQKLQEHVDRVCCVSFSPDDRKIASGGYDNTIKVFWLDPEEPPEYMTVPIKNYLPPKKDGKSSSFFKQRNYLSNELKGKVPSP